MAKRKAVRKTKVPKRTMKIKMPKKKMAKKKKTAKKRAGISRGLINYAELVADPCMGPLVNGLVTGPTGGSVIERFRQTLAVPAAAATNRDGYLVFFPSYHGAGQSKAYSNQSIFYFEAANTSTRPTNTIAAPLGSGVLGAATGTWLTDNAYSVISGATSPFVRAKSLAACAQLEYVGALSSSAGQICTIANISLNALIQNTTTPGVDILFPTVDEMFAYAAERRRLQIDGHEVKYRPTPEQDVYRAAGVSLEGALVNNSEPDTLFWNGSPAATASKLTVTDPAHAQGIVIAWRGIPGTLGSLTINLIKVVELELAPRSGVVESMMTKPTGQRGVTIESVTKFLDDASPGWQRSAATVVGRGIKKLVDTYMPTGLSTIIGMSMA